MTRGEKLSDSPLTYRVVDAETGEGVLGPYESDEYARKCMDRYEEKWPGDLVIEVESEVGGNE